MSKPNNNRRMDKKDIIDSRVPDNKKPINKMGDKRIKQKSVNDASWYKLSGHVNDAICNLPFSHFPGKFEPVAVGTLVPGGPATAYQNYNPNATPGVLALTYLPSYGSSGQGSGVQVSAVDTAAKALYTWVRHQNSGHSNYEAVDLMLYILAMDHVYSYYFELKRILATAMTYELVNRNVPDLLLEAMNVNAPDLRSNLAVYRGMLNLLAAKLSSMAVPDKFSVFKRHALLASTVFTDSSNRRAQFYLFKQESTRIYDAAYDAQGGGLRLVTETPGETFAVKLSRLETMIDAIISDDDMNIMSGDILKAFGRENLYTIAECEPNETVPLVFDENVLQQIENSHAFSVDRTAADIHQANNSIIEEYSYLVTTSEKSQFEQILLSGNLYFNSHKEDVTPDDCMEFSRLCVGATYDANTTRMYLHPGSEIVVDYIEYQYSYTPTGVQSISKTVFTTCVDSAVSSVVRTIITNTQKFDWHPIIYVFTYISNINTIYFQNCMGDLTKYTLLAPSVFGAMNDVALMAELGSLVVDQFKS